MKQFVALICGLFFAGCKESNDSEDPRLSVYCAGWRSSDPGVNTVGYQGSHFLRIERAPVTLKLWHINDGKKTLAGEVGFDPAIHESAYVSPFASGDKSYIDFGMRHFDGNESRARDSVGIDFPAPHRIGSFLSESTTTISKKEMILTIFIIESPNINVMLAETESMASMLKASSLKPLSFFVIEAEPNR